MGILKKINWKVRFRNKVWVMGFIGALFVLANAVLNLFGIHFDFTNIQQNVYTVVEAIFGVLVVVGVITDGTTENLADSARALTYHYPTANVNHEAINEDAQIEKAIELDEFED